MKPTDKGGKPSPARVSPSKIPAELKDLPRWVGWKYEWRDTKWDRPPISCVTGRRADVNSPENWTTFKEAVRFSKGKLDGVGFVLNNEDPYTGIDLDGCRDSDTGLLHAWAARIVQNAKSYVEVSPSGTGVHIIVKGKMPKGGKKRQGNLEIYSQSHYFTVTGNRLENGPSSVRNAQAVLNQLHTQMMRSDEETIQRAMESRNGEKFSRLWGGNIEGYPSDSEADLALCGILAYWTFGDAGRMEKLFSQSRLGKRDKWTKRADYRKLTIEKAINGQPKKVFTRGARNIQEHTENTENPRSKHIDVPSEFDVLGPRIDDTPVEDQNQKGASGTRQGKSYQYAIELAVDHRDTSDWEASFKLARVLRKLDKDNPEQFEGAVEVFCEKANRQFESFWYSFLECWEKVRHADGEGELAWAAQQAEKSPFALSYYPGRKCEQYKKLASIAYHFSCLTAPKPFWLTRDRVKDLIGCRHPNEVSRIINLLEKNGVIQCVNNSYRYAGTDPKSKEYVFTATPLEAPPSPPPGLATDSESGQRGFHMDRPKRSNR